jgi:hypothetical protein
MNRHFINLLGRTFGKLKVIEDLGIINHKRHWKCACSCGGFNQPQTSALLSGKSLSCGCTRGETFLHKSLPYRNLYNVLLDSAKRRSIKADLTYEEFVEFTSTLECHYCKAEIVWSDRRVKGKTFSRNLDRKDNSLEYSKGNCVVCCPSCNKGKMDQFTYEEWVVMSAALREFRNESQKTKSATA